MTDSSRPPSSPPVPAPTAPLDTLSELERKAQHFAALVASSDDAIVSKDLNSVVTSWNEAAERMFGYAADEMIGASILRVIPDDRRAEEDHVLGRIRAGLRVDHFETIRRRKDGTLFPVSLTVSPIRSADGAIVGASKIARDISDRKRAEDERQRLVELAHQSSQLKDDFLATLSHELRTPLNGIVGFVQMLQKGLIPAARQQWAFDAIARSVEALTRIVEDVLDVSRIVSGKVIIEMKALNLADIVETAVAVVRPAIEAKQISLSLDLEATGPIMGDADRLQQVVWNIVANAAKFSPPRASIAVRLRQSHGVVVLAITDTGAGIAPEFLPYVFDRFRQEDQRITRGHGGLGLGLAISKHLVELHGGRIFAESPGVGQGATFTIELPRQGEPRLRQLPQEWGPSVADESSDPRAEVPDLAGRCVLAVDDDPAALVLVREMVELTGATILTAASSAEALRVLSDTSPDILLADIGMPHMSGFDLIATLRQSENPRLRHIPAAALTAYAHSDDRAKSLAAGFNLHLPKPVGPKALFSALSTLAQLGR